MDIPANQMGWARPHEYALPRSSVAMVFLAGLIWSLLTGFAFMTGMPSAVQALGLFLAAVLLFFVIPRQVMQSFVARPVMLVYVFVIASVVSTIINHDPQWLGMIRDILLFFAFTFVYGVSVSEDPRIRKAMLSGLATGAVVFCLYNLKLLRGGAILNSSYRLQTFLDANGIGFICAMTAVVVLHTAVHNRRVMWKIILFSLVILLMAVEVATKSRTAGIAMGVGIVLTLLPVIRRRPVLSSAGIIVIVLGAVVFDLGIFQNIFGAYHRYGGSQNLWTLAGRTYIWKVTIFHVWLPHFFFGVGPDNLRSIFPQYGLAVISAHNGIFQLLGTVGVIGTAPIIIILWWAVKGAWRVRHHPQYHIAWVLLATGLVESLAEQSLFSLGNPGSLLFLLAVTQLAAIGCVRIPSAHYQAIS